MSKLLAAAAFASCAFAQTAYTVVETNAMFGQPVKLIVYRSGSKAVVDHVSDGKTTRTLYDLTAHTSQSWDASAAGASCSSGTFSGDWGDPFAQSASASADLTKQGAKETGAETINGVATKVYEAPIPGGKGKVWMDPKSGLMMRMQMFPASGPPQTFIDVTQVTMGAPAASLFALPAGCAPAKPAAPESPDFVKAIMPPAAKGGSCTVLFRVMRGDPVHPDVLEPVTSGFKMALGPVNGATHDASAQVRNGVLRIDNAAESFNLDVNFVDGGSSALIYRQCFSPQTVLLLVLKNPAKTTDGADWFWVKSNKYRR